LSNPYLSQTNSYAPEVGLILVPIPGEFTAYFNNRKCMCLAPLPVRQIMVSLTKARRTPNSPKTKTISCDMLFENGILEKAMQCD
jgi:hypothetical protein